MSYLDQRHTHRRLAGVTGVAIIHLGLAAGLVAGLTIKAAGPGEEQEFVGKQIPLPPPPEPTQTPEPEPNLVTPATENPPVAPVPDIDLTRSAPIEITTEIPPVAPIELMPRRVIEDPPVARPAPTPTYTPRAAAPRNGPAGWITNDDYPRTALLREWEGTVGYALAIGADGKVQDCRIVRSSGRQVLDEATCRHITRRAAFEPATDGSGSRVAGNYSGSVTWRIPE